VSQAAQLQLWAAYALGGFVTWMALGWDYQRNRDSPKRGYRDVERTGLSIELLTIAAAFIWPLAIIAVTLGLMLGWVDRWRGKS
jgi:hypothetical protein